MAVVNKAVCPHFFGGYGGCRGMGGGVITRLALRRSPVRLRSSPPGLTRSLRIGSSVEGLILLMAANGMGRKVPSGWTTCPTTMRRTRA